jgi:hypothetical protein
MIIIGIEDTVSLIFRLLKLVNILNKRCLKKIILCFMYYNVSLGHIIIHKYNCQTFFLF